MKIVTALVFTILLGCSGQKIDTKAEGEKLMEISREWSKLAATGDIEKTLSYWAEDAVIMSPGQPTLKGKAAIRQMIEMSSKIPGFKISWEPLSAEVSASGDFAYLIEQNQITMRDTLGNPVIEYNKSLTIWRKDADGSWKNVVDMWNDIPTPSK